LAVGAAAVGAAALEWAAADSAEVVSVVVAEGASVDLAVAAADLVEAAPEEVGKSQLICVASRI
jgi:hypothetical protein